MFGSAIRGFALAQFFAAVIAAGPASSDGAETRPRLIVLTDIGGDPDDQQSMVRLMLYSCDLQIDGLIASASGTPGELKNSIVRPDLIRETVRAYGEVQPNLRLHNSLFPPADSLRSVIKSGNPIRGTNSIGPGKDTEGSEWIISVTDRSDTRPVNISIWGGSTELAQALWKVHHTRSPDDARRFDSKLRVYAVAHQDDTGPWVVSRFTNLFYVLGLQGPGRDKREAVFRGMYLGGDETLTSRDWVETHVRKGHGPLGALYPDKTWTAPNPHSTLKEGDTPSWLYFLRHGLSDTEHPEWGGWGGRFTRVPGDQPLYRDAADKVGTVTDARASVWRWRPAYQAEFAARMDWCVKLFAEANHSPIAVVNGESSKMIVEISARSGEMVRLSAEDSSDPDGQRLSFTWDVYREAGTFKGDLILEGAGASKVEFAAPPTLEPATIHIVLGVRDDGIPALTSYRRIVVRVRP